MIDDKRSEVLLYAESSHNADMRYFSGVDVPDPFIAFSCKGLRIGILSQLEFNRVKQESCFDEVLSLEDLSDRAKRLSKKYTHPASLIAFIQKEFQIKQFRVSPDFPLGLAEKLTAEGVNFTLAENGLFPARQIKTDGEAKAIREGNRASSAGFQAVERLLKAAIIKKGYLYIEGKKLTSEHVRKEILSACAEKGALAQHTIVAGGNQACDPHCVGHGPLKANEFIIVDIFPRNEKTGYYGDMTRTYLKGKANEEQRKLYQSVFEAQQWALQQFKTNRSAKKISEGVVDLFKKAGYETRKVDGVPVGFIHGLGHGLGLEIHEAPRVNLVSDNKLRSGEVITVEPGLYYPGLGGVRIEDVVRVTPRGPEMLSKHSYRWEIR